MFIQKFEIGKEYRCTGLYDDEYIIKVVDRTEETISFIYDERTSDNRSVQVGKIEIQKCSVYDVDLKEIEKIETETMIAWEYHSRYAEPGEYDYGYYFAFDNNRLYNFEEWEAIKSGRVVNTEGWTIRCDHHTYVTLEYEGKFVYCFDNDIMKMDKIIESIEKRTKKRFSEIAIKGSKEDFNGLRFITGFKDNWL